MRAGDCRRHDLRRIPFLTREQSVFCRVSLNGSTDKHHEYDTKAG